MCDLMQQNYDDWPIVNWPRHFHHDTSQFIHLSMVNMYVAHTPRYGQYVAYTPRGLQSSVV